MKRICSALADTGNVDYLSVSIGIGGSVIPPMYVASGAFVYLAASIKEEVDIPVFCAGRVVGPIRAEDILAKNQADMVAMTRACICDPELPKTRRRRGGWTRSATASAATRVAGEGHSSGFPLPVPSTRVPVVRRR
jgi:2,4-dienoyl-CoA reductase-like NADH-dependent reductase (Old Yellow Enzyme family)